MQLSIRIPLGADGTVDIRNGLASCFCCGGLLRGCSEHLGKRVMLLHHGLQGV